MTQITFSSLLWYTRKKSVHIFFPLLDPVDVEVNLNGDFLSVSVWRLIFKSNFHLQAHSKSNIEELKLCKLFLFQKCVDVRQFVLFCFSYFSCF